MSNRQVFFIMVSIGFFLGFADSAFAGTAIDAFQGPLDDILATIGGPLGKTLSMLMIAITAVAFYMKGAEMESGMKMLIGIVFCISLIAFAGPIVNSVFGSGFTGAQGALI